MPWKENKMPKGGLSYRSLEECLKGARAKGLPESTCDVLKKHGVI